MRIRLLLLFFVALTLTSCAHHTGKKGSWVLNSDEKDPAPCCDVIIDRLVQEYPPAQTTLYFSKSENLNFDRHLETQARKAGYKISQRGEAVKISYVIDVIGEHNGFLHLKSSEGFVFNQMFRFPNYFFADYTQHREVEK